MIIARISPHSIRFSETALCKKIRTILTHPPHIRNISRLTENIHILSVCADYPQISGCRRAEYGHLTSKRCCKRPVSDKANRTKSDVSPLTVRERAQKSAYLCFSALASCTVVPRRAEKQALMQFRLWHIFSLL